MKRSAFLLGLFLLGGCEKPESLPAIRPVRAMQLEEAQRVRLQTFPGRTRAVGRVNLSFRVDGPLIERPVNVGVQVKRGALLARIDPRDFEIKLETAEGKLERAQAQLRFAVSDYDRAIRIWKQDPGAISQSLLDQKEEERNELKGEVRSLEAEVAAAKDQLSYTYLLAPFDGVVVATYVENYEYVKAKQPIVRLLNTTQVEMVIDVPENLIGEIPLVDHVEVEFDSIPGRTFPAEIKEIGTEASKITRTYPVTLLISQPEDVEIYAGMAGRALLSSEETDEFSRKGFLLPTTALFTDDALDKTFVWVVDPSSMQVSRHEVEKGKLTNQGIYVTKGVHVGEWVVTSGVHQLHEGQKVRILPMALNKEGDQIPAEES